MPKKILQIPTNLIMGFLGVGKTTAILNLLKQKPKNENWAVLVNEFGKVGIDGAIYQSYGATVKEISGGCLCCAVGLPFKIGINRLLKEVRPDRLLIEPTGLGHPKKVLEMLENKYYQEVLDLKAVICLVDPSNLQDERYRNHENFVDQIALADVLVANKTDLATKEAIACFDKQGQKFKPAKALVAQTTQGQLDICWLDFSRNSTRQASFPAAHEHSNYTPAGNKNSSLENKGDGFQSFGYVFPEQTQFDYSRLMNFLTALSAERIKGMCSTNQGWYLINGVNGSFNNQRCSPLTTSKLEIIAAENQCVDISAALLLQCFAEA